MVVESQFQMKYPRLYLDTGLTWPLHHLGLMEYYLQTDCFDLFDNVLDIVLSSSDESAPVTPNDQN